MIDVFCRFYPTTVLRRFLSNGVWARLVQMPGIRPTMVTPDICGEPFHIKSKQYAEENAKSEIYCVMDDDQLPLRDNFFLLGMGALIENLDYGMVAGMPLEYLLAGQPYADVVEPLVEAHSIGCPYFVRKGTITKFPDAPLHFYDGELSKVITDQGLKTGLVRYAVYNHLGYGFSQVEHAKMD